MPYFTAVGELGGILAEAAVPGDGDDGPAGCGRPGAQCGRIAEPDRPEIARHQDRLAGGFQVPAQRVSVIADVDGDDGVVRQVPRQRVEDRRGGHATASFVSGPPGLFRPPDRPPGRHRRALVLGADRAQFL
jgi:hypothetical protein